LEALAGRTIPDLPRTVKVSIMERMPYRRSREDEKMEDESLESAAAVGRALIIIQLVELLLDSLLKTAFCGERVPTVREIEARTDDLQSLVNRLHKRVEVDPKFKTYLKRFVKDRNRVVHNLVEELVKKSASEEEAHRYYRDFSERMTEASLRLMQILLAKFFSWRQTFRPNEPMDEDTKLYIEEAGKWMGSIDQLFRKRE
jgi:hypothetical protein